MSDKSVERILGYNVQSDGLGDVVNSAVEWINCGGHSKSIMCANPHSIVVASRTPEFNAALARADWLLPDGIGILYASKLFGGRIRSRITGYDVFSHLMARMSELGSYRCFFLGSTQATLDRIVARVGKEFPEVEVAGTYSPPYKKEFDQQDIEAMLDAVNKAKPGVLWVGLTAPKQELFIHQSIDRLDAKVIGAIGAVFDFYAGTIDRPGHVAQRLGMEWLVRMIREPRRLWRRTLVSGPRFLVMCLKERFLPNRDTVGTT